MLCVLVKQANNLLTNGVHYTLFSIHPLNGHYAGPPMS